jgi:choline dehydrogenase-like flavoprotein
VGAALIPFAEGSRPAQGQVHPDSRNPVIVAARDAASRAGHPLSGTAQQDAVYGRLGWFGAKDIRFEDAVEFSETAVDHYGMPAMSIRYELTAGDLRTVELMKTDASRAAHALGTLADDPVLMPGGSSMHYQGATRMGIADDGESVCDSHGRVWAVSGLYVAGNNVIPTATACNPTLTSVALAVRAARQLVAELQERRVRPEQQK